MIRILTDLLFIQLILVYLLDLSGGISSLEWWLSRTLHIRAHIPRPFSCSLCMTWWISLVYLICTSNLTLPWIAVSAALSFLTKNVSGFLRWTQEFLVHIENILYRWIK